MSERTRTIRCTDCHREYDVTQVRTIEGRTIIIEEPTLLATAFCPYCGKRAEVLQGIGDAGR
jgi:DNA-directed RNA polymerase subunit RPC12/RpoP